MAKPTNQQTLTTIFLDWKAEIESLTDDNAGDWLVGSATPRVFVIAVMHASYMAWLLGWAAIMPVRLMWACAHSFI